MSRIPDEELQRIKSQVKVEDLCREYGVELKRMGPDNLGMKAGGMKAGQVRFSLTGLNRRGSFPQMPRTARKAPAGIVFHVLNRGVGRRGIFEKEEDYAAFERVMGHALVAVPVRLLSYCLMPNHWHLLLCPQEEGQLGRFMQRLTMTHTRRWQEHYRQVGVGHLYQGRFKSFPVQEDAHFLIVARYIERNALRANLVARAEHWRWSNLWRRIGRGGDAGRVPLPLAVWPVEQPMDWLTWVNDPQTQAEVDALRVALAKGRPFGDTNWQRSITERLGLQSSHRRTGRPKARAGDS